MPEWLLPVAALAFTIITPFLAWWGSSRYFEGQWEQWREHSEEWRIGIGKRLDAIDYTIQSGSSILVRLERAERDILDLRQFKHERVEPYIRALDVQRSEIDQIKKDVTRRMTP